MMSEGKSWSPLWFKVVAAFLCLMTIVMAAMAAANGGHNYGDALSKSILFFEGQRSGKLPNTHRMTWRKDSGLRDGSDKGVDLVGGYYDAGDNVKYSFPMAFTTTMLAWSVLEYGDAMGNEKNNALDAIRWSADFLMKATNVPNVVYAMVGEPIADHNCWERPEDMDTPRTAFAVTDQSPGSEVSAEIAAALASASMAFASADPKYSHFLYTRAIQVFEFADKFRGSYNNSNIGKWVCPFYCDFNGYQDELVWAAAWLYRATHEQKYWDYVKQNINNIGAASSQFGWDSKQAGINVLVSHYVLSSDKGDYNPFIPNADALVCFVLPESPKRTETYTPGGLMFVGKGAMCNIQRATAISFLVLTYGRYSEQFNRTIDCGNNVVVTPTRLKEFAKSQVDYILGSNPMHMSYMVGYGEKYPQRIHHRGSSLPSVENHPKHILCNEGSPYAQSKNPNPNLLIGAVVGGPDGNDQFYDDRTDPGHSEPTTYVNAPLVGLLAHFNSNS